jgi:3-keto-5-aminohexanoate cleavage enzyme
VENIDPTPEMSTINAGTFGFKSALGEVVFLHPLSFNVEYLARCKEKGIRGIEIEVYDTSHIANAMVLAEEGALTPPLHFSIVLGIGGGAPATPENLIHMVKQLPEGSTWQVVAVGRYHVPTTMMAMAMGGNVRTGLEDTVYYRKGELAKSNAQLVERMVRLAHEVGREPATVEEAREILLTRY